MKNEFTKETMKEIQEIMIKHLSGEKSSMLQGILTDYDKVKKDLETTETSLKLKTEQYDELETKRNVIQKELNEFKLREDILKTKSNANETKEQQLKEKEMNLENTILKIQLEEALKSKQDIFMLTNKVFGVPTVTVDNYKNNDYISVQKESIYNGQTGYTDTTYKDELKSTNEITTTTTTKQ